MDPQTAPANPLPANVRRIVIKLGTGVLTKGIGELHTERIDALCGEIARLRERGIQVVVVSSGAVGLGMGRLRLERRPADLTRQQMCASVGQSILTQTWQSGLDPHGLTVGQVLLTRDDVSGRRRHVAVMQLFEALLAEGIIPIVNENDSVSALEIKFGDNDMLAALVASFVKADLLFIVSTVAGLMRDVATGELVPMVDEITPEIETMAAGTSSPTAVGGMRSKIEAAKTATGSGCGVFICSGLEPGHVTRMLNGNPEGTFFAPRDTALTSKQRWLAYFDRPKGFILVDTGAKRALIEGKTSLLAKGVTGFTGTFPRGGVVGIAHDAEPGAPFARGISSFASTEIDQVKGLSSERIKSLLPDRGRAEVVHRDTLVLIV